VVITEHAAGFWLAMGYELDARVGRFVHML
jgi:hypothetical protein